MYGRKSKNKGPEAGMRAGNMRKQAAVARLQSRAERQKRALERCARNTTEVVALRFGSLEKLSRGLKPALKTF